MPRTVTARVEVSMDEFDIEDLISYLDTNGYIVLRGEDIPLSDATDEQLLQEASDRDLDTLDHLFGEQIAAIHQALKLGQDDKALTLTRAMIKEHTGCAIL